MNLKEKSSVKKGFVISDFHFCDPAQLQGQLAARVESLAATGDFLIFNGDTFDFRGHEQDSKTLMEKGASFLETLARKYPSCRFFFIQGNHDGLVPVRLELSKLERNQDNFSFCPVCLRIGGKLFLHGDLPFEKSLEDPFVRPDRIRDNRPWRFRGRCYVLILRSGLYRGPFSCLVKWYAARGILKWLDQTPQDFRSRVREVYYGHIHLPFADYRQGGILFHNSGSGAMSPPAGFPKLSVSQEEFEDIQVI